MILMVKEIDCAEDEMVTCCRVEVKLSEQTYLIHLFQQLLINTSIVTWFPEFKNLIR